MRLPKDKRNEYDRKYYQKNIVKIRRQKAELMRKRRMENPQREKETKLKYHTRLKNRILEMYGMTCSVCGFDDRRALTLDHIKNNGAEERRQYGERGVWFKALKEYNPDEYRILCMNCQFIQRVLDKNENQFKK
jgi:hypothetical protein